MITTTDEPTQINSCFGGKATFYDWAWHNQQYQIVYETIGQGQPILILPAFSTVSSRQEMKGIAQKLATQYQVTVVDWLGFGESDCPPVDYNAFLFTELLPDFVTEVFNSPIILIAAGHASGYALKLTQALPELVTQIILIAPTWQGPLQVMGLPAWLRNGVKNLVRSPIIGQILYYLNTTPAFLRWMYQRHVYVEEAKLTPEFIQEKHRLTSKKGARYGPASFVTGAIDPVNQRSEFLSYLSSVNVPLLIIVAENAPPQSKAEMLAMTEVETVESIVLTGTLGIYEEFAESVSAVIQDFITRNC